MAKLWSTDPRDALRVTPDFDLSTFDRAGAPGFDGDRDDADELMAARGRLMAELQERLYANGRAGGTERVLVVVQGLDTAGKGGIARHVMGMVDPQGVALRSFGVPTEEERAHHYLWRIERALPKPGQIGLFDRSHYEDVLVVRVDELVPPDVWGARYEEINAWEKALVDDGVRILKFAMMVSHDEQGMRLMERLDRPDKRWKFSTNDLKTRAKWDAYQEAYADVFRLTSTEHAPWYVLPADRKWFPRLAITEILTRTLVDMDLRWPLPAYDPAEQRAALAATMTRASLEASLAETSDAVAEALAENVEVKEEVAALLTAHGDKDERKAAKAAAKERKREWEADLAATLAQKRALLS
ncbi:MAG: polyphosphate kinase 2 family protein [Arachnia sp.]